MTPRFSAIIVVLGLALWGLWLYCYYMDEITMHFGATAGGVRIYVLPHCRHAHGGLVGAELRAAAGVAAGAEMVGTSD